MLSDKIFALLTGFFIGRIVRGFFCFYDASCTQKRNKEVGGFFEKEIIPIVNEVIRNCRYEDRFFIDNPCKDNEWVFGLNLAVRVENTNITYIIPVIKIKYIQKENYFIFWTLDAMGNNISTTHTEKELIQKLESLVLLQMYSFGTDSFFSPEYVRSLMDE